MAIHVLDKQTAELIAAGEVVERPASVVKELLENAIDAGASQVTVEIERGGVGLIRISDNGCGIEKQDIPLAFLRHATSKVRTQEDLEAIHTLGFRGEALASVASVARVELLTKSAGEEDAWLYGIQGGQETGLEPAARAKGTTLTVRELFYNTPARMKFLKKDVSEGTFVAETVGRLALSHPEISFRFVREGKQVFATPGDGELRSAVYTVLGPAFAKALVPVKGCEGAIQVEGLVTPPRAGRASRAMQHFFLNGRYVKNGTIMAALEQAYRGLAMQGRFPGGVLFVTLPAELVDVNVHPAKTEVRFAHEQEVFQAVYRTVKAALVEGFSEHNRFYFDGAEPAETGEPAPGEAEAPGGEGLSAVADGGSPGQAVPAEQTQPYPHSTEAEGALGPEESLHSPAGAVPYSLQAVDRPYLQPQRRPVPLDGADRAKNERGLDIFAEEAGQAPAVQPVQQTLVAEGPLPLQLVGELFKTYIVAQRGDVMCLVDKHAAHERLLYEKIAATREAPAVQQLLAPVSVALGAEEKEALLQNGEALRQAGIEAEDFGGNAVLVRGIPADVQRTDVEALVTEVAGRLAVNSRDALDEKTEWVLHSIACRAAVKAGDHTTPAALLRLAQEILDGTVPPFCPHGRPVVLEISRKELEKQFGRLG